MFSPRTFTAIAALTVLALTVADPATGDTTPQPLPGQYDGPPKVTVESRGHELRAGIGSFCWSIRYVDQTGLSICADTFTAPVTKEALPVRGKRIVHIDLGRPAEKLDASLRGQTLRAPRRTEPTGRHWVLRLPTKMPAATVLNLGAEFTQGSVPYGVSLRRAKP